MEFIRLLRPDFFRYQDVKVRLRASVYFTLALVFGSLAIGFYSAATHNIYLIPLEICGILLAVNHLGWVLNLWKLAAVTEMQCKNAQI